MKIKEIELREITMKRKMPFASSRGIIQNRRVILVFVRDRDGMEGFGESSAPEEPRYCEEWTESVCCILESLLIPRILRESEIGAAKVRELLSTFRGNRMAKAAIEMAIWDLEAKRAGLPLWKLLGGDPAPIPCGVALGIASSVGELLDRIDTELESGYQRIKLKIQPSWDVEIIKQVRKVHPQIPLMVDANGAYGIEDLAFLRQFDEFNLMMIEQPFAPDDLVAYRMASERLSTKLCLDETIVSQGSAKAAAEFALCSIANLKLGRMGGHTESRLAAAACRSGGIETWCGGQHETGLGRAHNIALASQLTRTLPAELSASSRYWEKDIILPEITIEPNGSLLLRNEPGIGYELDHAFIDSVTVRKKCFVEP